MSMCSSKVNKVALPVYWIPVTVACLYPFGALSQQTAGISSAPLREPTVSGDTLFSRLDAHDAGLAFQIDIDDEHPRRRLYEIAFAGSGISIGDYDDDGRPDLFMTHHADKDRLYRQVGNLVFEDVTDRAGLGHKQEWSAGTVFVDIDNDGDLDLYVCHYDAPNSLYINRGDGTFEDMAADYGLDYRGASVMAAFSDYDRDGDLDMYLLTSKLAANTEIENQIPVERGRGPGGRPRPFVADEFLEYTDFIEKPDGRFEQIATGQKDFLFTNEGGRFRRSEMAEIAADVGKDNHMGMSALWWDFNNDQWPDLYVANDLFGPDRLYRNNGDGSFTNVIATELPHTPWYSMGSDFGDINNDGYFDLMTTDMSATTHYEQKVGMGDMDSQVWFLTSAMPRQYMRNALFINTGAGPFMESARLSGVSSTDWTWSVKLNDFDNDGMTDIFFSNGMVRNFMDSDVQNEIDAAIGLEDYWEILRKQPPKRDVNMAFRNYNGLQFENVGEAWGLDHRGMSFGAAVGDLDRDGDLDLVVSNLDEPVSLYRNDSVDGGRILVRLVGDASNRFGIGARVSVETEDGIRIRQLESARGFMSTDEPILHFATASAASIKRLTVQWPSGRQQSFDNLAPGNLYTIVEDNQPSATEADAGGQDALFREVGAEIGLDAGHRELYFDDYRVQPLLPAALSQLGPGIAWGDVDNDDDFDVYVGGAAGDAGKLLLRDESGEFRAVAGPWLDDEAREDMGALWLDVDGDGDQDLLVASGSSEFDEGHENLGDRLYLNDGSGSFTPASPERFDPGANASGAVAAADFDADGDLDVFIGGRNVPGKYPLPPESRLLRNDGGAYTDITRQAAGNLVRAGMVTSALWSDYDNDDDPDLLLTVEWGPVRLYRNDGGSLSEVTGQAGLSARTGWWNSIASVDADNDGDLDYVVGNVGLNTKYHATQNRPATLYYGDMSGTGVPNLIEVEWEEDTAFPVRGLSCSSDAMPFLANEFQTFDAFARADIQSLFTPARLNEAQQFNATELASGLLVNNGSGGFEFRILPPVAQIAPVFGIVTGDFNADGRADIYLVQNSYAPQAETGRMNGGISQLLYGNGSGDFVPVPADESGLIVTGDAKSLTITDLDADGRADFLVARNDDRTLALKNSRASGQALAILLRGTPGNLDAIGSRVELAFRDGSRQAAEIHGGAGYLSQSVPALFFGNPIENPILHIDVRWPDGVRSRHLPQGDGVTVISHPGTDRDAA